ncbi:MAG: hypothetical protein AB8B57_04710 [Congregibacter sp.]
MTSIYRIIVGAIGLCIVGLAGLGLFHQYRGLPPGTLDGARELARKAQTAFTPSVSTSDAKIPGSSNERAHGDGNRSVLRGHIGCDSPFDSAPDPGMERTVYSWRDTEGVSNFSDEDAVPHAQPLQLAIGNTDFFVSVRAENAVLPASLESAIRAGARRSYAQWSEWLGREEMVRAHINIRFLGDEESFAQAYGKPNKDGWTTTGFYRVRSNEALVLYTPPFQGSALGTAYHEMSHLITAWHLGSTPPWLNEGIAEHFETMQLGWQNAEFAPNRLHLELLQTQGPVPLQELTQLSHKEWGLEDPLRRYASAWSLIAFLLDSRPGQQTLQQVVKRAHAQRCNPRLSLPGSPGSLREVLDSFPGGASSLEMQWRRWVREA